MIIGTGGYGEIWHPPRKDGLIEKSYRNNKRFVQRYTHQTRKQIENGEIARKLFDPHDKISNPIVAIYKRPNKYFSEILPFREGSLLDLLQLYFHKGDIVVFSQCLDNLLKIFKGMKNLHAHKWVHHDIKASNIMYDTKPTFKLFMIDWGSALPFKNIFKENQLYWLVADNQNHPPEYKSIAHYLYGFQFKNNNFVVEYAKNPYIRNIVKLQPNYLKLLKEANKTIGRRIDNIESIASKGDVFGLGIVLCQLYIIFVEDQYLSKIVRSKIIRLIWGMINPNPFRRWNLQKCIILLEEIILLI